MNLSLIALIALLALPAAGAEAPGPAVGGTNSSSASPKEVRCLECHTCANPTKADTCLAPCPRPTPTLGPTVVLISQLSAQYEPVIFAHKLHSQMSEMSGGCSVCHHFNPANQMLACRDCHSASQPGALPMPSLRGAYHRLCLKCHREWNQDTKCDVCHTKKMGNSSAVVAPIPSDIVGILHPNVKVPVSKIYQTSYDRGRLVTFRHQEHVQSFGFKCVDCHREENCSACHQPENVAGPAKSMEENHARCSACHEYNGNTAQVCTQCHSDREIPQFSHQQTGLALDQSHKIANCVDCHAGARFRQKPTCSTCHEADISYPAKLPGTRAKASGPQSPS